MTKINFSMPVIFVEDIKVSKNFYKNILSLEVEMDFGENIVFKNAFSIWQKNRAEKIIFENKIISEKREGHNNVELYFETIESESACKNILTSKSKLFTQLKKNLGVKEFLEYTILTNLL